MQIDVFTLLPHAFSWLTEQRPLAAVLGSELELRFLNYRDYTPLTGGQVDDEPYGGGPGWCSGWTSSAPRSRRSTATRPGGA